MSKFENGLTCDGQLGFCGPEQEKDTPKQCRQSKPIEVYFFLDPLCYECWAFEPFIKKLYMEYGRYFMIRYIIGGRLDSWNAYKRKLKLTHSKRSHSIHGPFERTASRSGMSCDGELYHPHLIKPPLFASIAVKAAELQGKKAGIRYLQALRFHLFLNNESLQSDLIYNCAKEIDLDWTEFQKDLLSQSAQKAFQCDVKFTFEMEVNQFPTLIFFNEHIEDAGLKVECKYPYEVYVHILEELVNQKIEKSKPMSIEEMLNHFEIMSTKEIAIIYDLSDQEAERKMKQLLLKQKVERIPNKYGTFWKYLK